MPAPIADAHPRAQIHVGQELLGGGSLERHQPALGILEPALADRRTHLSERLRPGARRHQRVELGAPRMRVPRPHGRVVDLQVDRLGCAEHHRAEPAIAEGTALDPAGGLLLPTEDAGHDVVLAGVANRSRRTASAPRRSAVPPDSCPAPGHSR